VDKTWIGFKMSTTIEVANADGSGQRTIVKLGVSAGDGVDLTWSPDGRSIVFNDFRLEQFGVWIVPSGGGTPRLLFAGHYAEPSWAPAGT
jgi:Tol biopolymer transport system component